MAGPISAAVRGAAKAGKKAVRRAPREMDELNTLLSQIADPEKVTNAQLRKLERMIPGLNAAQRKQATEFLGLSPDARFPNKTVLGRAGMIDPENLGKFPEAPVGRFPEFNGANRPEVPAGRFPEAPQGRFPDAPAGRFPSPPPGRLDEMAGIFGEQMLPERLKGAREAFANQVSPNAGIPQPQRTGKMSAMLGALSRNKGKVGLGLGAAGIGGAALLSGGSDAEETSPEDAILDRLEFGGLKPMPSHGPVSSVTPPKRGGMGMSRPKPNPLTGQNGVKDITSMLGSFGAPDVDFEGMVEEDVNRPIPQFEEQKQGGGMGDFLKTMGPLLAAMFFGRMMK